MANLSPSGATASSGARPTTARVAAIDLHLMDLSRSAWAAGAGATRMGRDAARLGRAAQAAR
jgi:hypothetical protein